MKPIPLLGALAVTLVACSPDPISPGVAQLVGRWRSPTQSLQPHGTMEGLFIVAADGETENHVLTRGVYSNQGAGGLSTHEVLYGHIGVNGDKFLIHRDSLVTMDAFYGSTSRHVQRDFSGWPQDSTQYQIRANELHLQFYTYPADAPVLTHSVLYRVF